MLQYNIHDKVKAFTTHRTEGRDGELIRQALCLSDEAYRFVYPHQTHTDRVFHITEEFFALSENEQKALLEGIDAVVSDVKNACIGISTADCIPVLVYDEEHHAAAAIHAGWKGTVARIVENAMKEMQRVWGTQSQHCRCVIGPGISQASFEVGQEVVDKFIEAGFDMQKYTVMMPLMNPSNAADAALTHKPHIDLKAINRDQLLSAGIPLSNIEVSGIDTFTDTSFFSARREQKGNVKCGRILTGFWLK